MLLDSISLKPPYLDAFPALPTRPTSRVFTYICSVVKKTLRPPACYHLAGGFICLPLISTHVDPDSGSSEGAYFISRVSHSPLYVKPASVPVAGSGKWGASGGCIKEDGDVNKRIMLLVPCRASGGQMTGRQGHSALTCLLTHSVNILLCVCVCF